MNSPPPPTSHSATATQWASANSLSKLHHHTQDTPQSVGLLCTGDHSDAQASLYLATHNTHKKRQASIPPAGLETTSHPDVKRRDPRLRPQGHWDRRWIWNSGRRIIAVQSGVLGERRVTVPLRPEQTQRHHHTYKDSVSAVTGQRITAWAMAPPLKACNSIHLTYKVIRTSSTFKDQLVKGIFSLYGAPHETHRHISM